MVAAREGLRTKGQSIPGGAFLVESRELLGRPDPTKP